MNLMPVAQPSGQPELTLRSTANVWGKKSTPAAAAPTPMAPSTNSFANTTNKASPIRIQSILLLPAVTVGVGVHQLMVAPVVMVGTGLVSQRCSTSRASETAERIQKEKMAAALFGGISATQPPAPPPPSAAATSPAINTTPGGQWGAKPIAVAAPTPTAPAPAPAPVPVVAAPAPEVDLLGFDAPATTHQHLLLSTCWLLGPAAFMDKPVTPTPVAAPLHPNRSSSPSSSCRSCRSICRCRPLRWHRRHSHHSLQPMVLILRSMNLKAAQSLL